MKNLAIEIKWGIIFFAVSLLWVLLENIAGLHDVNIAAQSKVMPFFALVAVTIFALGLTEKRTKFYGGRMSWFDGFKAGLMITLVVMVLSPLNHWLTYDIIAPEYLKNAASHAEQTNVMTGEQASAFYTDGNFMFMNLLTTLGLGILTSAIVSIFTRGKARAAEA